MLLELNIKEKQDIVRYSTILKTGEHSGCSITSKKDNYSTMNAVLELSKIKNLNIIPTFSCKSNYNQNWQKTLKIFFEFIKTLELNNINQILLVSGNPKMKLDTLAVLEQLGSSRLKIAVVYNPYSKNITLENKILAAKLKSPNVNQVWLQLGQDFDKLKKSVEFIRKINPNIHIVNSILTPSKKLLNSLKSRPWSGVCYTEDFHNNLEFALQNVTQMKQLSQDLGLEILISGI